MDQKQNEAIAIMKEVLQEDLVTLRVQAYRFVEDLTQESCDVELSLKHETTGNLTPVKGSGVGLVDAVFQALKAQLSPEFPSLNSITFSKFDCKGIMSSGHEAQTDAEARVTIGVHNSYGDEFTFDHQSRSVGKSCVRATVAAVEYFVNSERAFVRIFAARNHYEREGRTDLITKYTNLMSQMVRNTSYSEVLDRLKVDIG